MLRQKKRSLIEEPVTRYDKAEAEYPRRGQGGRGDLQGVSTKWHV